MLAHRDIPALMPYLHLPVQSGSSRILTAMSRRHDRDAYFRIIDRLREVRPDLAPGISSSAFPARPTGISPTRCRWWTGSATPRPIPSNTARVPARRPPVRTGRCPKTSSRPAGGAAAAAERTAICVQPVDAGRAHGCSGRARRRPAGPGGRTQPLYASREYRRRRGSCRPHRELYCCRGKAEQRRWIGPVTGA